jgi:hypothetical protein
VRAQKEIPPALAGVAGGREWRRWRKERPCVGGVLATTTTVVETARCREPTRGSCLLHMVVSPTQSDS